MKQDQEMERHCGRLTSKCNVCLIWCHIMGSLNWKNMPSLWVGFMLRSHQKGGSQKRETIYLKWRVLRLQFHYPSIFWDISWLKFSLLIHPICCKDSGMDMLVSNKNKYEKTDITRPGPSKGCQIDERVPLSNPLGFKNHPLEDAGRWLSKTSCSVFWVPFF